MAGREVIAIANDHRRREVVLDRTAWNHLVAAHPELRAHQPAVLGAVETPEAHVADPRPGRERFFASGTGPSAWIAVIVDFNQTPARVVTAFPARRLPRGATSLP
jgi:hypothetical protein